MTKSPNPSSENAIDANAPSANEIILDGYSSDEIKSVMALEGSAFVEACYGLLLGRPSDYGGLRHHVSVLEKGESKESVLRGMYGSEEAHSYRRRHRPVLDAADTPSAHAPMVSASPMGGGAMAARALKRHTTKGRGDVWIDMTTSFEWTGGVVGIVRAELELAVGLKKNDPSIRFSMQVGDGFAEIPEAELSWLLEAENVADAYMKFFDRYSPEPRSPGVIKVEQDMSSPTRSPFKEGDMVFSCGWMDSKKEIYFSRVRKKIALYLCYLIYDTILYNSETKHFYHPLGVQRFTNYLKWIAGNCDFLLFGGETAKKDFTRIARDNGWPSLPGRAVKFGSDIAKSIDVAEIPALVSGLHVREPFILVVGSLEPRKNHETLYRAYLLAMERAHGHLPQMVFAGKPMGRVGDLVNSIGRDPRIQGRLLLVTPTDMELAALYKSCMFCILASVYEGWSLTLPESFGYGKFCLAADVPPLREVGGMFADYVSPYDVSAWADAMLRYSQTPGLLKEKEAAIAAGAPKLTWSDTAGSVGAALNEFRDDAELATPVDSLGEATAQPSIWMDLTLTYLLWGGGLTGIVRTELTLAYHIKKLAPDTRFFAYEEGRFFEIHDEFLAWLLSAEDLSQAYKGFHEFWQTYENAGTGFRSPFRMGNQNDFNDVELIEFPDNSIVFFAGIDMDGTGELHRNKDALRLRNCKNGVIFSQLIYDFTPILFPHLHLESTCNGYAPFVDFVQENFDHVIYGGRTAQKDGAAYAVSAGRRHPMSDFLEFGSDFVISDAKLPSSLSDADVLSKLGVHAPFIMTVGTLEPRKNHQVLYKALLAILNEGSVESPFQMLFIGRQGWHSDDLMETIQNDERVAGRILIVSPTDDELDVLYRNCSFTLLPSFYEGWSLTLPESLAYGKFSLVSDVAPLRETGGSFVDYIHPLDNASWARLIAYYLNHPEEVDRRNARIREEWRPTSWHDAAQNLIGLLHAAHSQQFNLSGESKSA